MACGMKHGKGMGKMMKGGKKMAMAPKPPSLPPIKKGDKKTNTASKRKTSKKS